MRIKDRFINKSKKISIRTHALIPIFTFSLIIIYMILRLLIDSLANNSALIIILITLLAIAQSIYIKNVFLFFTKLNQALTYYSKNPNSKEVLCDSLIKPFSHLLINDIRDSIEKEYATQIYTKQADINALQGQINPHFLYNTLDSIRGKAQMQNEEEIANMIESLASFFRYSISRKGNMVALLDEINNVDTYIKIQKFRFGDKFEVIKVFDEEDYGNILIPKLTLQPIIENAIHHGIETSERNGTITIRIIVTENQVLIRVSDNGLGIDHNLLESINSSLRSSARLSDNIYDEHPHGIAIKNVNDRIRLAFGEEYGIIIYSTKDIGTDVDIRIPLERPKRDFFTDEISN